MVQQSPTVSDRDTEVGSGRVWALQRMMKDLTSGDEAVRIGTLCNLVEHPPGLGEALPLLRQAMVDPLERIRDMAVQAVSRLSGKVTYQVARHYEEQLPQDLTDLASLTFVLCVYSMAQFERPTAMTARQRLILRVVEQIPEARIAGTTLVKLLPEADGEAFDLARKLWLSKVDENPTNARVLGNAAEFFVLSDRLLAGELLRKCKEMEPENPEWARELGYLYSLETSDRPAGGRKNWTAALSLAQLEEAYKLTSDKSKKFAVLVDQARVAFDARDYAKCRSLAEELLETVLEQESESLRGHAIHQANVILGRLSLLEGKTGEAKSRLIAAISPPAAQSRISIGPQGPNMALAKDLLELGEAEIVLDFLRKCVPYWQYGKDRLADWIAEIDRGRVPDFGVNLRY